MDLPRAARPRSLDARRPAFLAASLTGAATRPWLLLLVTLGLAFTSTGCASAPSDARLTLREFAGDQVVELVLVSRSYIERTQPDVVAPEMFQLEDGKLELDLATEADFYSQKRESASAKVASDQRMRDLLKRIYGKGFTKRSTDGSGPTRPEQNYRKTLEVETAEGVRHFSLTGAAEKDALLAHQAMAFEFRDVYNAIYALQSVEPRPVEEVFQQPEAPDRLKR